MSGEWTRGWTKYKSSSHDKNLDISLDEKRLMRFQNCMEAAEANVLNMNMGPYRTSQKLRFRVLLGQSIWMGRSSSFDSIPIYQASFDHIKVGPTPVLALRNL